jgi:hypothetical protein
MALSPNYGWAEPDNASLVKNGAQDIRALGDAIDTSVWNVGYGQAGKNKIINGNFGIWQRGTTFTNLATNSYSADRWRVSTTNSTIDVNQSSFTAGTAPVAGYEGQYFATIAAEATDSDARFQQAIEDVRTFAGQIITVSFWAKSTVTTDALRWVRVQQAFGSGGSAVVNTDSAAITLTSSWARYSVNITVPSISGKTIGTGSSLVIIFGLKESTAQTLDLWGVQAEYGSKATPFQTATGTLQGELAACQRYYYNFASGDAQSIGTGFGYGTTEVDVAIPLKVTMRTTPTIVSTSGTGLYLARNSGTTLNINGAWVFGTSSTNNPLIYATVTGSTNGQSYEIRTGGAAAFVSLSAEL